MIAVDELLRQRAREGKPIRVGLVGAGAAARMIAVQLLTPVDGIRLVAIANRTLDNAARIYADEKMTASKVTTAAALDDAIAGGTYAITADAELLCDARHIDLIIDATGAVESGAKLAMRAIENRKHVVLVNTELDSTLGPILKVHADKAGVTITNTDGDEPGVAMNLVRYVRSIGLKPVATGNLKGMVDVYRTPETQASFAAKYSMNPKIVTSFADGTKLSMEATVEANATGFRVGKRGMWGPRCDHVNDIIKHLPLEPMLVRWAGRLCAGRRAAHRRVCRRARGTPGQATGPRLFQDGGWAAVRVLHAVSPPADPDCRHHRARGAPE